jgi:hypothetical protein
MPQQIQLAVFAAACAAFLVAGCILTRKSKKSCQLCGQRCRTNVSPAVSLAKKKGAAIGQAPVYRSLKKLGRLYNHLLMRDKARRIAANIAKLPEHRIC